MSIGSSDPSGRHLAVLDVRMTYNSDQQTGPLRTQKLRHRLSLVDDVEETPSASTVTAVSRRHQSVQSRHVQASINDLHLGVFAVEQQDVDHALASLSRSLFITTSELIFRQNTGRF